ncbi:MAG: 1-hydroxycarotenoid 3,4-desaturase CrtD [Paracoccaceae bacterium]
MFDGNPSSDGAPKTLVVGAGIGGLSAALRLQSKGHRVTLFDTHDWPGGKMRTVPSEQGPIDAGPTVLTMRHVFDDLFAASGARLDDHVTLIEEPLLARHFWPDGTSLDLTLDHTQNASAIKRLAGPAVANEYLRFSQEAAALFDLFDAPMMQSADPSFAPLAKVALQNPRHLKVLSPFATLRRHLAKRFSDRRLVQLFGRYATYVGGSPLAAPAILSLIWQAEFAGVWRVDGGMHKLAHALAERFVALGGMLRLGTYISEIQLRSGRACGVTLANGDTAPGDTVVFAGDPYALATGRLGKALEHVAPQTKALPRSLSARVWSFAATAETALELGHHNVFFGASPTAEFEDLAGGAMPKDPTIYVCAEDRGAGAKAPSGPERFEIILNAAPLTDASPPPDEEEICHQTTFQTLERFGLRFNPTPKVTALATPTMFEALFPGSAGSLYGQTPHGMTAGLKRPRARTPIPGLYLAGGGTHPGAGVPMAALSGKHAAEAILKDRVST